MVPGNKNFSKFLGSAIVTQVQASIYKNEIKDAISETVTNRILVSELLIRELLYQRSKSVTGTWISLFSF